MLLLSQIKAYSLKTKFFYKKCDIMIKNNFNYAERLRDQLKAMSFNPVYKYVATASDELMKKNGFDISDKNTYIDLETYNDIMISAGLFKLVGKTPERLSILSRQMLNNCRLKLRYTEKNIYIYLGNYEEIYISAKSYDDNGNIEICMDEPIRSDYGEQSKLFNGNDFFLYDSLSSGYNYISGIFDAQNDKCEDIKDFSDYPTEFENEFLKDDIFDSNNDDDYEGEWLLSEYDNDCQWFCDEENKN